MRAHVWTVVAEFDAGYVIGRCQECGQQELLDVGALLPTARQAPTAATDVATADAAAGATA